MSCDDEAELSKSIEVADLGGLVEILEKVEEVYAYLHTLDYPQLVKLYDALVIASGRCMDVMTSEGKAGVRIEHIELPLS